MNTPPTANPGWKTWIGVLGGLAAVTAFHYLTSPESVGSHNIYRRLYYLPIVWAAFAGGWRGGLAAAGIATLAYLPHAFFMHHHLDPAPTEEKAMEMVLYFGVGGLAGFLVDRERKARRREARRTIAQLAAEAQAERLEGLVHLSRGLAHEIRNPLGGIQGAIEILADSVPDASPGQDMVQVALKETERLGGVLNDFLEFARPRDPEPKEFNAGDQARHVAKLVAAQAENSGKEVLVECARDFNAVADPEQVTQVLINLVRNSLQASPEDGQMMVRVLSGPTAGDKPPTVRFEVIDDGPGVPEELGDSIFDPYVTGRDDGTGLGLAISALLVRQNGGQLHHDRSEKDHTRFWFELPTAKGDHR